MSAGPQARSALPLIGALLGLFLGGGALGGFLAAVFAPGSWVAAAVSFFALPVAFAAAMQAWYGLALLGALVRLLGMRRRLGPSDDRPVPRRALPGAFVFVPFSSAAGAAAGLVVGLASTEYSGWLAGVLWWLVGTAHGLLGWRLAKSGVLLPPESI